jgi:hypothetical protein
MQRTIQATHDKSQGKRIGDGKIDHITSGMELTGKAGRFTFSSVVLKVMWPAAHPRTLVAIRRIMGILSKLFGSRPPREPFDDPVLGALQPTEDGDCWEVKYRSGAEAIGFLIAGGDKPSEMLIAHTRDVIQDISLFKANVREFLEAEKENFPIEAHEDIDALTTEQLCLFWPDRPDDGMIYFEGSDEERIWRCDYIERQPKALGFDS